jgi:hypothetical protein
MGIEFIRSRSKSHQKAQSREYHRAVDDLLVRESEPRRSLVFMATVTGDIEEVSPDTELLLQASGDHLDCFYRSKLVAVIQAPPASWLARIAEQPEGLCAGTVEERHRDAGKIKVRITI